MIVRNEEATLRACIESFRDYVEELIIVDTGSTDSTPDIARQYANFFEVWTECNDHEGKILSFSKARNRSFLHATQPWVGWFDGDDIIKNAQNIPLVLEKHSSITKRTPVQIYLPYEYAHDEAGNSICTHERERFVSNKLMYEWRSDVHETLCAIGPNHQEREYGIQVIHKRDFSRKPTEPGRNLRILKNMLARDGEKDVRFLYYLGKEYGDNGDVENALKYLQKYVARSGWEDEKYMACLRIVEHHICGGRYDEAIDWSYRAIQTREDWGEGYFKLAECYYHLANAGKDTQRNWERCAHFAHRGLSFAPTKTSLFVNPVARNFDIHKYLNVALNALGDVTGARNSVVTALNYKFDAQLASNKVIYDRFLARTSINKDLDSLVCTGGLLENDKSKINRVLDGIADVTQSKVHGYELPENIKIQDPPQHHSVGTLLVMVQSIWKHLMINDELLGARNLLNAIPWQIRDLPEIIEMKSIMDQTMAGHDDLELFEDHYLHTGDNMQTEVFPLPGNFPDGHSHRPRWDYLLSVVQRKEKELGRKLKILDVGCMDGWATNRLGILGHEAYGIDSCASMINLASQKAQQFNTGAQYSTVLLSEKSKWPRGFPKKFDVIILFEVYEHVHDTQATLTLLKKKLVSDGSLVVSMPRGSWSLGFPHPGHHAWNTTGFREHIRSVIPDDLFQDFGKIGLHDVDTKVVPVWDPYISGQATLVAEAKNSHVEHVREPLNISMYVGHGIEKWNPSTVAQNGIGGSETAAMHMSKLLVNLGNKVTLYGHCDGIEGTFDGVNYIDGSKFNRVKSDILITSRRPAAIEFADYKASICWIHDITCGAELTHQRALKIDKFFTLSQWHHDFVLSQYNYIHPSQVEVTRNGIDMTRFNRAINRNPHRAVYSSSADRGLETAVRSWPEIRKRIPDAELHIFYGFDVWEASARQTNDQGQLGVIEMLKNLIRDNQKFGVFFHGRVDQDTLAREYLASGVWAYPTWFTETSCQLAGSLIFTKNGMKPIESIQVGDLVLTHRGRFRPVTKLIQKKYDGDIFSIKSKKNCNPVVLTKEHPVYTATFHKNSFSQGKRAYGLHNKKLEWRTPDTLTTDRDYLVSPKMPFGCLESIKLSDYVDMPVENELISSNHKTNHYVKVQNEQQLTPQFMRILGLFAAEGSVSKTKNSKKNKHYGYSRITFAFHKKETKFVNEVTEFFGKGNVRYDSGNGVSVTIYSSPWAYFLKNQIGTGRKKKLPDFIWECSSELQSAFIDGIMDGDGHTSTRVQGNGNKSYTYRHYTSVSPSLAYGTAQLLANQGIYPSITYFAPRKNFDLHWGVDQSNSNNHQSHRTIDEGYATRIKSIDTTHYEGLVYNFEVEEDESYVTDRTIVHNCISAMEAHAAGLHMVTSPIAALQETVGSRGTMISGDWLSSEYRTKFVDEVCKVMLQPSDVYRAFLQNYAKENFSWKAVAQDWDMRLRKIMDEAMETIVVPYKAAS